MKVLSDKWRKMNTKERYEYDQLAIIDKERYEDEYKHYHKKSPK